MIQDIKELQKLGMNMDKKLVVDLMLQSLPDSFGQFIMNYHMNEIDRTLPELLNMLVIVEGTLKSSRGIVLTVERTSSKKNLLSRRRKSL